MWRKEDLLYAVQYAVPDHSDRCWEVFVAKDDNRHSEDKRHKELVWLVVAVEWDRLRTSLHLFDHRTRMPATEEAYLKAAPEIAALIEKLFGKHRPCKMLPAINKVLLKHCGRKFN
jgi:hypothetical protein